MTRKTPLLVTAITFCLSAQLSAQSPVDKDNQGAKRTVPAVEDKERQVNRVQAIEEVRAMQDRVLRFQNSQLKITTMILLADVLWGQGKDEPGARLMFLKANELIRSVRVASDGPASENEKTRDAAAVSPSVLRSLKTLLVQKVSPHDGPLGQRLSREYGLGDGSAADIAYQDNFAVSAMIKRGQIADATKALHNRLSDNLSGRQALHSFLKLLFELRAQDQQAADRVFIEAAVRMSGQPDVTANDVLIMGNYLFAAGFASPKLLNDIRLFGTSPIQLGDVVLQADIAQVRPGSSAVASRAYIGAATQILERGSNDPEETRRRAAAAHLLLPHAQAFAPEFVPQLLSLDRGAGIDFSRPNPQKSLPVTKDGKVDLDSLLESIDAIATSQLRDQFILKTFRLLYAKGELDAALTVGEKLGDQASRNQLVSLVTFAQGVKSLEAGQIEIAQKSLNRVTSSLQRFLLRLGLARLYLQQHDKPAAQTLLNEAINDSRDDGDALQQPYLVLSAVAMLASVDLPGATSRLGDAIKAFNALETPRRAQNAPTFWEAVRVGDKPESISLRASGVTYGSFAATMKALSSDPQGVRAVLFELKDESILSEGMIAFAYAFLA